MSITAEIETFILEHREHGQLTGDATEPGPNGYKITIACPCHVVLIRWVAPTDAAEELTMLGRRK